MSAAGVPGAPGGLRAGQLGVIVIGRVIIGDIAVTLADLAQRRLLTVSQTTRWLTIADSWTLRTDFFRLAQEENLMQISSAMAQSSWL